MYITQMKAEVFIPVNGKKSIFAKQKGYMNNGIPKY